MPSSTGSWNKAGVTGAAGSIPRREATSTCVTSPTKWWSPCCQQLEHSTIPTSTFSIQLWHHRWRSIPSSWSSCSSWADDYYSILMNDSVMLENQILMFLLQEPLSTLLQGRHCDSESGLFYEELVRIYAQLSPIQFLCLPNQNHA
ncbi:unnamed protein product [Linum trigynum]|uniref:Uncharacterized protein n=1 Tax=Linum trigynum TaxID=586398 RepID=A0AAV2E1N3_9ROSI